MKLLFSLCLCFISYVGFAQIDTSFLKNESIKFKVILITPNITNKTERKSSQNLVRIEMPDSIRNFLLLQDGAYWMRKLNDNKSDWAANLTLYYLYNRDALLVNAVANHSIDWNTIRNNEIDYWNTFLKKKPIK